MALQFDNAFVRELPGDPDRSLRRRQVAGALYSRVQPTPVASPQLLAFSSEVAVLLGLDEAELRTPPYLDALAGNGLLPGMEPYAANYGGHQFGNWAGPRGDGRAITRGEVRTLRGERGEMQLKGAGPTPYSRSADGRAVLRSSLREFLCSEAMHHLGVPTTRALSLVLTGEQVVRDLFYDGNPEAEPGAVVCRVAPSFIRFGNFELPASRGDHALLNSLVDFTIRRDYPALLVGGGSPQEPRVRAEWFAQVCERTALMVAHWMRVGFVHGVMNTDNMSILGLTIDYGPYGWIDNYDPDWTPNTTDAQGRRYRYAQQPAIAHWNLARLAGALLPVMGGPGAIAASADGPATGGLAAAAEEALHAGLKRFAETYARLHRVHVAAKLGLAQCREDDVGLMRELQALLHASEMDMTLFFRNLAQFDTNASAPELLEASTYDAAKLQAAAPAWQDWMQRYAARLAQDARPESLRRAQMDAANPRYVLRNYLAQQAIDRAVQGDSAAIGELLDVLRHPYDEQPGREAFAQRRPDWARHRAGCSMLSCSS